MISARGGKIQQGLGVEKKISCTHGCCLNCSLWLLSVTVLGGQSSLPADIHPESLSRLPPVQRGDLNDDGKRIWDAIALGGRGMPLEPARRPSRFTAPRRRSRFRH